MVEGVNAVAGSVVEAPDYGIPASDAEAPTGELGKDAFLKLLVAQLKYQDPLEPSSSEEFIATTAQFTVVEKLDELTKQGANTALVNSLATASALVGREVTANQNGEPVTAVVEQSRIVSGAVVLETSQGSISLNEIVSVGAAPAATPVAPTPVTPAAEPVADSAAGDPVASGTETVVDTAAGDPVTPDTEPAIDTATPEPAIDTTAPEPDAADTADAEPVGPAAVQPVVEQADDVVDLRTGQPVQAADNTAGTADLIRPTAPVETSPTADETDQASGPIPDQEISQESGADEVADAFDPFDTL